MKGIIFTEFIEMVEENFGFDTAEKIISESSLPSSGIYTAVGTYNFTEMVQLVSNLSKQTEIELPDLLFTFGQHLFGRFREIYPHFFENNNNSFDFLGSIENYIHVEVLKLYPDAQLPSIDTEAAHDGNSMKMVYKSSRSLGDLACGLMTGCFNYFDENIEIKKTNLKDDGTEVSFLLTKK